MSIYMYFFLENCLSNIYHYTMVVSFIIINMYILKNINKIKILNNSMTPPLGIIACFLSVSPYFRCPSALQRAWFLSIFPHQPVNSLLQELRAVFSHTFLSHCRLTQRSCSAHEWPHPLQNQNEEGAQEQGSGQIHTGQCGQGFLRMFTLDPRRSAATEPPKTFDCNSAAELS